MARALAAIIFAAISLTGCGAMRLVDTEVRSFATPTAVSVGATYRFERLPSQQADAARQDKLEVVAQQALDKVGLKRDDSAASHSVQVSYSMKVDAHAPWEQPEPAWGWGIGLGGRGGSVMLGAGLPFGGLATLPYYRRQISLIIRSLASNQVVYESHATHDGRWADTEAVLPAMFDAVLKDFPNPPAGVRRINIEIPR